MRFWFSGPRFMGVRPGISFSPNDLRGETTQKPAGAQIEGNFVYVVRGDHNMVKIGVTQNPRARLAQLKTGSAFPIDYAFIGAPSGDGYAIEAQAMQMLAPNRVNGEWFDVSPELAISAVMGAAGKLGQQIVIIPDLATVDAGLRIAAGLPPTPPSFTFGDWVAMIAGTIALFLALMVLSIIAVVRSGAEFGIWVPTVLFVLSAATAYWFRRGEVNARRE